jgi:ABC-type lipoprotein release transport system permease subunit
MIQALTGIIIGSALAYVVLLLLKYFKIQLIDTSMVSIHWSQMFFVCALSLAGGLIASLFPIFRIYKLRAADIMKNYL